MEEMIDNPLGRGLSPLDGSKEGIWLTGGDIGRARRSRTVVIAMAVLVLFAFAGVVGTFLSGMFRPASLGDTLDLSSPNTARIHARLTSQGLAFAMPDRAKQIMNRLQSSAHLNRVFYTIKERGTLGEIGRFYGLTPEEMVILNPGVPLTKELPAGTEVSVYKLGVSMPEDETLDLGKPHLIKGVPMMDGPGRKIRRRGKSWGRRNLVVNLDKALRIYAKRYPEGPVVIVSDMSKRHGGKLPPHHTHREGHDVDLSYIPIPKHDNGGFLMMDKRYFDVSRNWSFVKAMLDTKAVVTILMDHSLQELLFKKARAEGISTTELRRIFQYPRSKEREAGLIRHWDGHRDHMHVRFACHADRRSCVRGRE